MVGRTKHLNHRDSGQYLTENRIREIYIVDNNKGTFCNKYTTNTS